MKHRFTDIWLMVIIAFIALLPEARSEQLPDWQVEARPGYAWFNDGDFDLHGFSFGAAGEYRVYDNLYLKLDAEFAGFGYDQDEEASLVTTTFGVDYEIDFSPFIPVVGFGVGPLFRSYEGDDWGTEFFWHLNGGFVFRVIPDLGLGIDARYHGKATSFEQNSIFFTLAFKLQYQW